MTILLVVPVAATAQYDLHSATSANAGGKATGAGYTLYATMGQATSGINGDGTSELRAGLLSRMLLAPSFSIAVLSSSVLEQHLSVYAVANRILDDDASGEFTLGGGSPATKVMARLAGHGPVYQTTYELIGSGNLTITVSGEVAGIIGETTRIYAVTAATPGAPFVALSPDGMALLRGAAGSIRTDGFILMSTLTDDIPRFLREIKGLGDAAQLTSMLHAGDMLEIVSTAAFDGGMSLMLGVEPSVLETLRFVPGFDERRIGIYELSEGRWDYVGGYGANGAVEAEIDHEGVYAALYNPHQELPPADEVLDGPELLPNFPNPFNPTTTIRFGLPEDAIVQLRVYDVRGQLIKELVDGPRPAGYQDIIWDGTDADGASVGTGVYFARLKSNGTTRTRKMLLLK
jgi:hypothetical protein